MKRKKTNGNTGLGNKETAVTVGAPTTPEQN
jgi:hypothetical protein